MKEFEENEDDLLDKRYPRTYGFIRCIVYLGVMAITFVTWFCIFLISCGCSPIVTSHTGYVILTNSHRIAVEHRDMDRPKNGIVRYYEFPLGHDYKIGDSLRIPSTQLSPNEPERMADKNNR